MNDLNLKKKEDKSFISFAREVKDFLLINKTARQTVAKNTFWLTVSNLGGRVIKAGIIVYSARVLGATEWGAFSYAVSFAALITIFTDFGIGPILTREASRAEDKKRVSEIISTAFFLKLILLFAAVLVVVFIAPKVATLDEAKFLFPIISLIIIFDTLQGFGFSLTRALEKMELEAFFYLLTNVSIVVFGFLVLNFYPKVEYFAYSYAAGTAVGAGATLFALRKHLANLFHHFKRRLASYILGVSWPFVLSGLLGSLMINTNIILIGHFLSATEVGVYSAADRPIQLLYVLPTVIATSIFPLLSRLAKKDKEKMGKILEKTLGLGYLVSIPMVFGGVVLGGDIIRGIFGEQYTGAVLAFRILILTLSISFSSNILSNAIFANDRQKDLIKYSALGVMTNLVIGLIFIPKLGITGSAMATLLAQILSNLYIWNRMRKMVSFSVLPKIKRVTAAAFLMAVVVFGLHRAGLNLALNILVGGGIYYALLVLFRESLLKEIKLILQPNASVAPENNG